MPTICSQDCQTTMSHAANQFSNDLQWDPTPIHLARHVQGMDVVDIVALSPPDDLSGPISAQWERDPVILQATAIHWRHGCIQCSGYTSQCVDRHYHVGKSQRYVVANTVQQQAWRFRLSTFEQWDYLALWRDLSSWCMPAQTITLPPP